MATLLSQAQALLTYINKYTQLEDTHLGDAIYHAVPAVEDWMFDVHDTYGVPIRNLAEAYNEWNNVQYAFHPNAEGKYGYLVSNNAFIDTGISLNSCTQFEIWHKNIMMGAHLGSATQVGTGLHMQIRTIGLSYAICINNTWSPTPAISALPARSIFKGGKLELIDYDDNVVFSQTCDFTNTTSIYLFASHGDNGVMFSPSTYIPTICIALFKNKLLVPFMRIINGEKIYGMLDLISNSFYQNANTTGSFTYSLE